MTTRIITEAEIKEKFNLPADCKLLIGVPSGEGNWAPVAVTEIAVQETSDNDRPGEGE